ncbi:ABC transporter ATP-binding protein [Rubellicoccus peritrichatus]|uniref:ABC transporter ATP-binding protein n=1 Tax=Rubellicoccus peritrichatus TaxID=3080537 RepID=A0AAQ3L8W2_9BACT|nr:ABC transporter ATP-binding protein [Puniceicoccus sp. CR14]WOO39847.1 ABC transporter ATP-binding protein [Puniceicoccus sp. CR14]
MFKSRSLLGFFYEHTPGLKGFLFWRSLSLLLITPYPVITMWIVDDALPKGDIIGVIYYTCIGFLLTMVHMYTMRRAVHEWSQQTQKIFASMRARIFEKLQFVHFGFLDSTQLGRMISKYSNDTTNIELTTDVVYSNFISDVFRALLMLAVLTWLDPWLFVFVIVMVPIFAWIRFYFFDQFRQVNREVRLAREKLTGHASELISAIKLIRGFGQEEQARMNIAEKSEHYASSRRAQVKLDQTMGYVIFSLYSIVSLSAVAFGAFLVMEGLVTLGTLLALAGALPTIMSPILFFTTASIQYFQGNESYHSIKELIDCTYVEDWKGEKLLEDFRGEIQFSNVSFRYTKESDFVLDKINLQIRPGENIALVGPSGSGKSSFINLLLGLYAPEEGEIRIDGVAQEELAMRDFRRQCALVMQDNILLSGTVLENLRFGKPDASEAEVIHAVKEANAWEFIEKMPLGIETEIGERGVTLSGGQRQRLAIARAILCDPKILILDEATSALDYESEALVQEALDRVMKGRTSITIAHRLSTVTDVDRVIVLREGRVYEQGSFKELADCECSYFFELLSAQRIA